MPNVRKIWEEVDEQLSFSSLIASGESETLEFKTIAKPSMASLVAALISGFANAQGGLIIFGITDDGELTGINPDDFYRMFERAQSNLVGECVPSHKIINFHNKSFGIIKVEKSEDMPLATRQGYFIRLGSTTQKMDANELSRMFGTSAPEKSLDSLICTVEQQSRLIEELNDKINKANSLPLKLIIAVVGAGFGALSNQILSALDIYSIIQLILKK